MEPAQFSVLPGRLNPKCNQNCLDWAYNMLAYGCESSVVIVDPYSMRRIQTLDAHPAPVVQVQWQSSPFSLSNPGFKTQLASGDTAGNIFIWDVPQASILISFQGKKYGPLIDFAWHPRRHHLLASLHSPSLLVLWNIHLNDRQWVYKFNEPIYSFQFNPFETYQMCLAAHGKVHVIRDFREESLPTQIDCKIIYPTTREPESSENFQLIYSTHNRNCVLYVARKRIFIYDLELDQVVGNISTGHSRAPILQAAMNREQSKLIYTRHEDGTMTAWHKKRKSNSYQADPPFDLSLHLQTHKKKDLSTLSIACGYNITTNSSLIAATRSDGTIMILRYDRKPKLPIRQSLGAFTVTGYLPAAASNISCIAVSNEKRHVALGTGLGTLQVLEMDTMMMVSEFKVAGPEVAVRGIRWLSPSILLFFTTESITKSKFLNKVTTLNIATGKIEQIRKVPNPYDPIATVCKD